MRPTLMSPPPSPTPTAVERRTHRRSTAHQEPAAEPETLTVYVPLSAHQQHLVQDLLRDSGAFTIKNINGQLEQAKVEWVVLPDLRQSVDADLGDLGEWKDEVDEAVLAFENPETLFEMSEYPFKGGQNVWVRGKTTAWLYGRVAKAAPVIGHTHTDQMDCAYYLVEYGSRHQLKQYFAPLNGDIKPDTMRVRTLLGQIGWL